MTTEIQAMGSEAARSNTNLYVFHIDWSFLQAYSASQRGGMSATLFRDMSQHAAGLEQFADAGGGAYLRVRTGAARPLARRHRQEPDVRDRSGFERRTLIESRHP